MSPHRTLRMVGRVLHALHDLGLEVLAALDEILDALLGLVRRGGEVLRVSRLAAAAG